MKRFIIKIVIPIFGIFVIYAMTGLLADGYTDGYYIRFATPRQNSLIIGTSRAAQGLLPSVFDSILHENGNFQGIFNFAFTAVHSPYGPVYYKAISKKLLPETKNGLFILAVDPWSVSSDRSDPENPELFDETKLALASTKSFSVSPNYGYLIKNYNRNWGSIILNHFKAYVFNKFPSHFTWAFLHDDGWLEVFVPMDSSSVSGRIKGKVREYEKNYASQIISSLRLDYLEKTVKMLTPHGDVFMVRLPVYKEIRQIENRYPYDFDQIMQDMAQRNNVPFLNLIDESDQYTYTDGNHLHKSSGKEVSAKLANMIKEALYQPNNQALSRK
jgi:hypothetical protein